MATIIESSKQSKFKISKKHSFKLSKNLLKTLTTNQLLLLLPTIVNKIIRDNNIQLADDSSNQTEISMLTSEECCKSSQISLQVNKKRFRLCTNPNIDKSRRDFLSLPIISDNNKTIFANNLSFKNESTKTLESLFNNIAAAADRSRDNTIKKFKKFTKKWKKRNRKEFHESKGNVNTKCEKKFSIVEKSYGAGAECKSGDTVVPKYPKSKLIYEVNEISVIEFEEYIETINSEKFNFINTFLNKSYDKISPDSLKSNSFYYGELSKISELVQYRICEANSHSNIPITKCCDFYKEKNQLSGDKNNLPTFHSLEVKVDVHEDDSLKSDRENTSAKIYTDSKYENPITYEFESNYIIKVSGLVRNSINQSLSLLSSTNHEFEINQIGHTSLFEIEEIDPFISIKSKTEKLKSIKIRKIIPEFVEVHSIQIHFPVTKKFSSHKRFMKNISDSEQKSLQKQFSLNLDSTSTIRHKISGQHSNKNRHRYNMEILGLSTSKIVNGRFQHGWHCTYKNCMIFNSVKKQTCKNCLNPRWCHPPLSKRDIYCVNCGYINYKSRLYCKKCKFDFVKQNEK